MTAVLAPALLVVSAVLIEIAAPGHAVYHAGWYNVALAALAVATATTGRSRFRATRMPRLRFSIIALICGTATAALAGVASGLLGPDEQTVVGAPGQRVSVEGLGVLTFPFGTLEPGGNGEVILQRPWRRPIGIGGGTRYAGDFILRAFPRSVAYVEATDRRGNRLTITQPTGATFLSPVLLMQQRQKLAGLDLPYDSFNVPSLGRVVKAVAFTPLQAALLLHGQSVAGQAAVLFAVDDERGRLLPHAIGLSYGGGAVSVGDLRLRATIATYPAVKVFSCPNATATGIGVLLVLLAGAILLASLLSGNDGANVS